MKYIMTILLASALFGGGFGLSGMAFADQHGAGYDKCEHGHHKGMHHHMGWMKGMSDEQRKQMEAMHEDLWKNMRALREKMQAAQQELNKQIATDNTDQKAIDQKIDEIVKLKKQKMQLMVKHKIAVRKILNKEQRTMFDDHMSNMGKNCMHGKGHH